MNWEAAESYEARLSVYTFSNKLKQYLQLTKVQPVRAAPVSAREISAAEPFPEQGHITVPVTSLYISNETFFLTLWENPIL